MATIGQCLWFDSNGEAAANFYTSIFKNSKILKTSYYPKSSAEVSGQKEGSIMTVDFELEGLKVMALNGGPLFKFTPALSFFVYCDSEKEIDDLWSKLSAGGETRMPLAKYAFAEKYGFTADQFGVNWQLILKSNVQKIVPSFLFVDQLFGHGEEALKFYTSAFKNSKIEFIARDDKAHTVAHCLFSLDKQKFVLMEGQGKHDFKFNNAFSLVVYCETQQEIDFHWAKLCEGGAPGPCGWLTDKYGVSWQVVPAMLGDLMTSGDRQKADKAMSAILKMNKIDIAAIRAAFNS